MRRIKHHFKLINKCQGSTEADKAQVKTFYLQPFVAPSAQDHGEESIRSVRLVLPPRLRTQDERPKRSFLMRLSPSKLRKIRGARLMKNPWLRLAKFGASIDSPARIQYD
jgi:hypothetical protein